MITGAFNGAPQTWYFKDNGSLILPGAMIESVTQDFGGVDRENATIINLTKTVQKLANGHYIIPESEEGQMIHLVLQNNSNVANVYVYASNARIQGTVVADAMMQPFVATPNPGLVTFIYTDNAWQSNGGLWD
jgi:hypothetical protein